MKILLLFVRTFNKNHTDIRMTKAKRYVRVISKAFNENRKYYGFICN